LKDAEACRATGGDIPFEVVIVDLQVAAVGPISAWIDQVVVDNSGPSS
jgi:hypothetical protein